MALEDLETAGIQQMLGGSRGLVQRWDYACRDHGLDAGATARQKLAPERLRSVCSCGYITHVLEL